ncbi:serine carboxypeptidase [Crucibulum laeve]|uniref:Carboxypeptidase n=1 Tax=Crucibulum laeve TaxID=68775 RepID=A0A5C3MC94_9AGAR|nr:serine carboxypeptidase [Crucibulum laeve]
MFSKAFSLATLSALVVGAVAAQSYFSVPVDSGARHNSASRKPVSYANYAPYDEGLFNPIEDLSILSETEFTSLTHPVFPNYNVRIKKTSFCDETVKSYTGYIDIEARHLFFYFFESRNDPDKDDVIFWTNGGPGCSSSLGLFMELGPCRINDGNGTKFHPESWNSNANIFFIDQPIGVGFSYAEYGETVGTTEDAAKDVAAFVSIFFEHFSKFKGRPFHMAGESYGGRYVPVFAAEVYDQNSRLVEAGIEPINLASVMIGNGITDFYTMTASYFDMACTPASVAPILDIASCVRMKQAVGRCQKWMKSNCVDQFDSMNCNAAVGFCENEIIVPFFQSGMNPYDISKECEGDIGDTLCYPVTKHISAFLDRPKIRVQLGVDPSVKGNFSSCNSDVGAAFVANMDEFKPTYHYIAALLERNVDVLIYVGNQDWICNWVGNEAWTLELEWSGQEEFGSQDLREWTVDGKRAGLTRSAGGLTFATVEGAGHMVPYDKPKESLALVNRWLNGTAL